MKFLDTNIILRYLVRDDEAKFQKCCTLFEKIVSGNETVCISSLVIAEIVWVLEKYYNLPKNEIAEKVQKLLNTPHVECDEKDILMAAAGLYDLKKIDFIDAYHAVLMESKGMGTIYSYDEDFDAVGSLKRLEP